MSAISSKDTSSTVIAMGKRKRAVVSYAEPSSMMDIDMDGESDAEEVQDESDDDMPEDDGLYGSRKVCQTLWPSKRLTHSS